MSNLCVKIVLGDFNAKVRKEEVYRPTIDWNSLHEKSNDNGIHQINFCMINDMTLRSIIVSHKRYKQNWVGPN